MSKLKNTNWSNLLHIIPFIIGVTWFFMLEEAIPVAEIVISSKLDSLIPFNGTFVIPYILWYPYILAACVFFFFKSPYDFRKIMAYLSIGMFLSCIIYTVYPNGQALRPAYAGSGITGMIIHTLYYADTPTNSLPSLHVIYSIGVHLALTKSKVKIFKPILAASFASMLLIIMSTVFVKQHSILDVIAGVFVSAIIYLVVYMPKETFMFGKLIKESI